MVIISHKYKFIVFKSYKTASSTIELFLQKVVRENSKPEEYFLGCKKDSDGTVIIRKHITPDELFVLMPEIKHYYKVCAIRNPFNQIVSCYIHNHGYVPNDIQLRNYIKSCTYDNNFKTIKKVYRSLRTYYSYILCEQKECIDFMIKTENLKDDLMVFLDKFNLKYDINDVKHLRGTKVPGYQIHDIYSQDNIELVKNIFKEELKLGNYDFPISKKETVTSTLESQ